MRGSNGFKQLTEDQSTLWRELGEPDIFLAIAKTRSRWKTRKTGFIFFTLFNRDKKNLKTKLAKESTTGFIFHCEILS